MGGHRGIDEQLYQYLTIRHKRYVVFVSIFHRFLTHVFAYHLRTMDSRVKTQSFLKCPAKVLPQLPHFPTYEECRHLNISSVSSFTPIKGFVPSIYNDVFSFLKQTRIAIRNDNNISGLSWVELMFLFALRGGSFQIHSSQCVDPPFPCLISGSFPIFKL